MRNGARTRWLFVAVTLAAGSIAGGARADVFTASAPIAASTVNPVAACPPDGAGTVFPGAEGEPFVAVNPTDPDNIVGVYQQDRYDNGGAQATVAAVSFDGGITWTQVAVPTMTRCLGGEFDRASDPWVSFGPSGVAHAMSLVTNVAAGVGPFADNGMVYSRSRDGGLTWDDPILLTRDVNPRYLNDKNSITADPNAPSFVYAVWDRAQNPARDIRVPEHPIGLGFKGPIYFTRTTDGGDSWEPARKIYETGANKQTIGNQIVVRPQGELLAFFGDIVNNSRRRGGIGPVFVSYVVSRDRGETWSHPVRIDDQLPMTLFRASSTIDSELAPCPDPALTGACPIRGGDLLPAVAVNRSNGTLYAVWMDARFSFFQTGSFLWDSIAFSQSTDGGQTWSPAIQVNRTPPGSPQNSQAFTPAVHVADDGTVTVTYYDFRNNTASPATLDTDLWAVHCHAASEDCASASSWDEEMRVTPASFDIRAAAFARGYFLGDYQGLAPAGNSFVSFFATSQGGAGASSIFSVRLTPGP
jgi:hypothetical protein